MSLRSIHHGAAPIALAVTLAFGCATVRVPASTIGEQVPVGEMGPEPQVELWLESGAQVDPAERARATAEVRAALARAARTLVSQDGESLLVVRAQGIARTASRRSNQAAAKVGIAVGVIAAAAIVIVAIVAGAKGGGGGGGKGGGGRGGGGGAARVGGGVARAAAHVPRGAHAVPAFRLPVAVPTHSHGGGVAVGISADVQAGSPYAVEEGAALVAVSPIEEPAASGAATAGPGAEPITLHLPPPQPLDLSQRKFFDKDLTRLELIVVDRATGAPTWVKVVEGKIDPRDAAAVERLLASAIRDRAGWIEAKPAE
ncbi:MAG TPA: hypothetical protein VLT47_02625 [Anaeromyxobacteraceae bacterium]|nr:hypothetical protein [Anaeromyxobacteraceae bacterium]